MDAIKARLGAYLETVSQLDPRKTVDAARVFTQCAVLFANRPDLKKCTAASLVGFAIQCIVLGFDPTPQKRECWAVPYLRKFQDGNGQWQSVLECQFQIGYGGAIKLAHRSGIVSNAFAYAVYEGDQYRVIRGINPTIEHIDGENSGDPSKVIGAYAVLKFKDGSTMFEALGRSQIERLRLKSPMQKADKIGGMWATDYDEAARIKALKRLLKWVPSESDWREDGDGAIITPDDFPRSKDAPASFTYVDEVPMGELPEGTPNAELEKQAEKVKVTNTGGAE